MKLCVVGHLGRGKTLLNGQTVKTRELVRELELAGVPVEVVDTHGWLRRPAALLGALRRGFQGCDGVIMLPAQRGVQVFAPLLVYFRRKYHKKIYYSVIGGWLPELLAEKPGLQKTLRAFDGIWVETGTMLEKLARLGFANGRVIPNFKRLQPLSQPLPVTEKKLCTFSRVMPEKGIQDAVEAVRALEGAFSLDIYGPVEDKEWFAQLQQTFPPYIRYRGAVEPERSVQVLQDYFALLFPTRFYTEGIPGTILDAYAAGVPVVSARWEGFADVVRDGVTGLGYPFGDGQALTQLLRQISREPRLIAEKKQACLAEAERYTPRQVIGQILEAVK